MFAESCPSREPPDLPFPNAKQHQVAPAEGRGIDLPATISSEWPLDELVRQELGAKSLDLNWATFTFNPLPDFDLCVLSSYSPRKGAGTQYAYDGAGLHRLSPEPASRKLSGGGVSPAGQSPAKKSSLPLFLSLALNVALVLALLLRVGGNSADNPDEAPTGVEMTESAAREKWELKWKAEWSKAQPASPEPMAEAKAKTKWEESWRAGWVKSLRADFEKSLRASGGEWPPQYNENASFKKVMESENKPDDDKLVPQWILYRSCKVSSDFIQSLLYNPEPSN